MESPLKLSLLKSLKSSALVEKSDLARTTRRALIGVFDRFGVLWPDDLKVICGLWGAAC